MWFIGEAVLTTISIVAGYRVIKLGFKAVNRMFDKIDEKL